MPIPSWIELSLIDACNRSCSFCPKVDPSIAPNTYQKMEDVLIDKLCADLKQIGFEGAFVCAVMVNPCFIKTTLKS